MAHPKDRLTLCGACKRLIPIFACARGEAVRCPRCGRFGITVGRRSLRWRLMPRRG